MAVAALYDIHGNLPALEAVLEEVQREDIDLLIIGGDVVSGPMPRESLDCLLSQEIRVRFILGNADFEVLQEISGATTGSLPEAILPVVRWVAQQITREHADLMRAWPLSEQLEIKGLGRVLFCHATPRNNTEVFTRLTPEERLVPIFADINATMVVCGHTHMQFDRRVGQMRVVNAGSVGMPYGQPGAYWLKLGPDLEFRHTAYDLELAAQRIRASSYPWAEEFARENVLLTPSEEAALSVFEPMSTRL